MRRALFAAALALGLSACATAGEVAHHPEARPYDEISSASDAAESLETAKALAIAEDKLVLAVFGANWCHDSRALAGWLETPRFRALADRSYAVVFVDVGTPQKGKGRNLDLLAGYGVTGVTGTPNLLVIDPVDDVAVNADTARSWRNAASRSEDAIYEELALLATTEAARD